MSDRYRDSSQSLAKPFGTEIRKRWSSTSTSRVSRNQVSKLAGESDTWSSPRAARQTCFASIRRWDPTYGFVGRWVASARDRDRGQGSRASEKRVVVAPVDMDPIEPSTGLPGTPVYVSGAGGSERIAPGGGPLQGDRVILPRSIQPWTDSAPIRDARWGASASFDTPLGRGLSSAGRRRAVRFRVPGAFVCLQGVVTDRPRGRMERIPNSPDEADLSAEEATPRQRAWLPSSDEDGRRPAHPGDPPCSRSKAADSLTSDAA